MSLYKRGGVWWTYVYVDGTRHARSTGTGSRRQAEVIEQRFKEELNLTREGMTALEPDMPFGELYARFLANADAKPYHFDRGKPLLAYFADVTIGRITRNSVREYRKHRHQEKPLSDTTINRDLECLRHILFWALDEGLLAANPLSRMRLVRERRKRRPVMSLEEEARLLQAASPHLQNIVIAALDTGMRRGEILQQRWKDIDFNRRLLFVTHSKTPEGEAREIPLTARLFQFLFDNRAQQAEEVIFTFKGRAITRIKTAWKATLRRAAVPYCRFHDLRHTFNTRLMEAGVMQEVRKALMGHSSGEDVHSRYTHVELPQKREAIRKLEAWVQASRESGRSTLERCNLDQPFSQTEEPQAELKNKGEHDGTF